MTAVDSPAFGMDSVFVVPPDVLARDVGGETVILALESGMYFGLDPIGAEIWRLIGQGRSLATIGDALAQDYDVARATLDGDIRALAAELVDRKLLHVA